MAIRRITWAHVYVEGNDLNVVTIRFAVDADSHGEVIDYMTKEAQRIQRELIQGEPVMVTSTNNVR